ncbi:MAG: outer membrane lipoprotein carrier protein LolA [Crocinitomicaceae bacterium]
MYKLIVVFFLMPLVSFSQEFKKLTDATACKNAIQKKQKSLNALRADFSETVYSSMLNTPQKGTGSLLYKQEQKIRWEHLTPKKSLILIDGSKVKYSENGKEIKDPSTKMVVKKVQSLMVQMLSGSFLDGKDFTITYFESASQYKLNLVPKNSRMSKYIESIVLVFNKKDLTLQEMSMVESEEEKVVYTFRNILSNPAINDSKFQTF